MTGTYFALSQFSQSDTTDAILVVEGKKLHVNKAFLSFHSDFFKTLFNADFMEKSMQEIPIKMSNSKISPYF
ncbi:hypothetical protein CRE_09859 [Caenorhabditis remanei]|uniref:BTB domain-containing protein n=1 Tax=Caenorhabditis remanei TaxID=31234 RepID=E3NKJ5_CAERE|nr:hypothetical protein CRE_09859 [Caenorhabditis remanei]